MERFAPLSVPNMIHNLILAKGTEGSLIHSSMPDRPRVNSLAHYVKEFGHDLISPPGKQTSTPATRAVQHGSSCVGNSQRDPDEELFQV